MADLRMSRISLRKQGKKRGGSSQTAPILVIAASADACNDADADKNIENNENENRNKNEDGQGITDSHVNYDEEHWIR
jgi:hypothetical protein